MFIYDHDEVRLSSLTIIFELTNRMAQYGRVQSNRMNVGGDRNLFSTVIEDFTPAVANRIYEPKTCSFEMWVFCQLVRCKNGRTFLLPFTSNLSGILDFNFEDMGLEL